MPSMKRHASIWVALALAVCAVGVIPAIAQAPAHDRDADQARGDHLRRERLVRPLLRDVSAGGEPAGRTGLHGRGRHAGRRQPGHGAPAARTIRTSPTRPTAPTRPNRSASTARKRNTADQNHAYTAEQQAYNGGAADLFPKYTGKGHAGRRGRVRYARPGHGLLRRQHGDRAVELRAALRDERQRVHRHVWPVDAGRAQVVSGQTNGMLPIEASEESVDGRLTVVLHQRRPGRLHDDQRRRSGHRRLLEHDDTGVHGRQEHRRPAQRRRRHVGRLHGRLQPEHEKRERHDRLQALDVFTDRR